MKSTTEAQTRRLITLPGITNPVDPLGLIRGSKHFTWVEALNFPYRIPENYKVTSNIIALAAFLDTLREFLEEPIHITSWYRDPVSNQEAGGVPYSQHLQGNAADWYIDSLDGPELYKLLDPKVKGGLGRYSNRVHTDLGSYGRWDG